MKLHTGAASLTVLLLMVSVASAEPASTQQAPVPSESAAKCAALAALDLSKTQDAIIQVQGAKEESGHCEVTGYVAPNTGFVLWIPAEGWNGKFIELGCAGACGFTLHIAGCAEPLRRGYACIVSDGGHKAAGDVKWAYNNPLAILEYFVRASHVTAIAGKAVLEHRFNRAPDKSYFMGCSAGGLQGTMEAERFPWDFDGIVAGAPSLSGSRILLNILWNNRALTDANGDPVFSPTALEILHKAVVASCDMDDGVKDGLIGDPRSCHFDPSALLCQSGQTEGCLTASQVGAAKKVYGGPVTSSGEQIIAPAAQRGSELTWLELFSGSSAKPTPYFNYFADWPRYGLFDPSPGPGFQVESLNFDQDYKRLGVVEVMEPASSPDLRRYKRRGGRLLSYIGWSDPAGGVTDTIDFYETAERVVGSRAATQAFFRLFVVPGMYHCGAGEGASTVDWLSSLEAWVEKGQAPDKIIGAHMKQSGPVGGQISSGWPFPIAPPDPSRVAFTRPLFPYPTVAKYTGRGDPNDEASFKPAER